MTAGPSAEDDDKAAAPTRVAANLALDAAVARMKAQGASVVHMGLGESRLPVAPGLMRQLALGAGRTGYGAVEGDASARRAAAGYFQRRNLPTDPEQIVLGPGSKPLLMALFHAVAGDVLLPRPCWLTYPAQARTARRRVVSVPAAAGTGGVPDPDELRRTVRAERARGGAPRLVVLTLPDNPSGAVAPPEVVAEVCATARDEDLLLVSDEIYRDVMSGSAGDMTGPAELVPERTVVTAGPSKSLGIGGWRIGAARFPAGPPGERVRSGVLAAASEIWSTMPGPMQQAAEYAFAEPDELVAHRAACGRIHSALTSAVYAAALRAGASAPRPDGAFYVYPDFESRRGELERHGISDGPSLERRLLERFGVAVLGGHHFGDEVQRLRFRASTSLLSGDTDEQRAAALAAADPLRLDHIGAVLSRVEDAFSKVAD